MTPAITSTATATAREFLRVSIDRSGREKSQDEQHDDNKRAADAQGWRLSAAYRETGSASRYATKARTKFASLLADLGSGGFNAQILIVWESSRSSRQVGEWVALVEACERAGVGIFVTSDSRLYDPAEPRDRRSLLEDAVDSEYESAKISKRAKRATAAGAVAGRPHGRCRYGYRRTYDPATGRLAAEVAERAEAKVVRELFKRLYAGHSLRSIAADFGERGIRTRSDLVFSAQHLRSLALNPAYAGQRVHDPKRRGGRLSADAVYTVAAWPALVKHDVFLAVVAKLTAPERVTTRGGRAVHLTSMVGRCDVCGGPLSVRNNRGPEYRCRDGGHVRIGRGELDAFVETVIWAYLEDPRNAEWLAARDNGPEVQAARDLVTDIKKEHRDLAGEVGANRLSAALAALAEPPILQRLREAREALRVLETPSALSGLIGPGVDVRRRWKAAPISARRDVVRLLMSPEVIGELRVTHTPRRGRGQLVTVDERVVWRRS